MVHLTKIYTKTGDKGETSLAAGRRITKSSARIAAIGCIDELNAFLGLVAEWVQEQPSLAQLSNPLTRIQNELFNLGSQLAVLPEDRRSNTPVLHDVNVKTLENEIDEMNESLPSLNSFVLPRGGKVGAQLHIARTVCRRAELALVALNQNEPLEEIELQYLNRLSDWLFVAARFAAKQLGLEELLWSPPV